MLRLSVFFVLAMLACTTTVVLPTETPTSETFLGTPMPTATARVIFTPTSTPVIWVKNPDNNSNNPDYVAYVTATPTTPTVTPISPSAPDVPFDPTLTQGVEALISCQGNTQEYWLEHGPPEMTDDLVQCINDFLEAD